MANARHRDAAGSSLVFSSHPKGFNNNPWQPFQTNIYVFADWGRRFSAKGQRVLPGICTTN